MEKKIGKLKSFFGEFKKFISRGNVLDMAVGVIVGGAFTAIVNGLSNFILKPIINWILALVIGKDGLEGAITMLSPAYTLDENGAVLVDEAGKKVVDLANSIYIDWGSFINAIINFFLIAFVLFSIVKIINRVREGSKKIQKEALDGLPSKTDVKEMKKRGINFRDSAAVAAYFEEKANKEAEAKAAAAEKARLDRLANPTTEDLLKEIRDLLSAKKDAE